MIRIERNGVTYLCDTTEEAARLGRLLEDANARGLVDSIQGSAEASWTPELYRRFVARLGTLQLRALEVMIDKRTVTGEYLCEQVGVSGPQALAGVLSGISRQATAMGLPARTVFEIETARRPEGRRSIYTVDSHLATAAENSQLQA